MSDKKGIFEAKYGQGEDAKTDARKDIVKNDLRRKFERSYDAAKDVVLGAKARLEEMTNDNFENFDLNSYRAQVSSIKDHEDVMKEIESLHESFFGEAIRK